MRPIVFDAYGTLLDVGAAARQIAQENQFEGFADIWPTLSREWRTKQLEYTWLRSLAGFHADFWQVTQDALDYVLEGNNLDSNAALRAALLDIYFSLPAFDDALPALEACKAAGHPTAILSNGTEEMLAAAALSGGLTAHLDAILSIDSIKTYKPSEQVYALATTAFDCAAEEVFFVSSNGWDVAGASGFGFETCWVNRLGQPQDRLFAAPHHIVGDLHQLPLSSL